MPANANTNFNSTIVRLKPEEETLVKKGAREFQFYNSSIKTRFQELINRNHY